MEKRVIFDTHCDTIFECYEKGVDFCDSSLAFNLIDALEKGHYIQTLAAYVRPSHENTKDGFEAANRLIEEFGRQKELFADKIDWITKGEDFEKVVSANKVGIMLSIENSTAIDGKLENVDCFYEKGVRMMPVSYSPDNQIASGCETKNDRGLTSLGKKYIKKVLEKGMAVDVSHTSEKSFFDVMKITDQPIIASHSNVRKLCSHVRNLTDEQIKEIAKTGGVIGICYCSYFLEESGIADSNDLVRHIDYIANLVGIDYIGLGSDFDGLDEEEKLKDIQKVKDIDILFDKLKQKGYSQEDINKIAGGNMIRVFQKILK